MGNPAQSAEISRLLPMLNAMVARNDLAFMTEPQRMGGGYSADLFTFRLANPPDALVGELVIRLMQDDRDARRESTIQQAVAEQGFPAPRVRLSGDSTAGLGRPFAVMDRVTGNNPVNDCGPLGVWRAFQRMPITLAETMAALHALDAQIVLDRLVAAKCSLELTGADAALLQIGQGLTAFSTGADSGLEWLWKRRPEKPARPVVCHGDLHALNLLAAGGSIVAVLDWELAVVADPMLDVARTTLLLRFMPVPISATARPLLQAIGSRLADQFQAAYGRLSRLDETSLLWHEALHCLRILTTVAVNRHHKASKPGARLWSPVADQLALRFAQIAGVPVTI